MSLEGCSLKGPYDTRCQNVGWKNVKPQTGAKHITALMLPDLLVQGPKKGLGEQAAGLETLQGPCVLHVLLMGLLLMVMRICHPILKLHAGAMRI
jgi:hypothetical protein